MSSKLSRIFVDTVARMALANKSDLRHEQAIRLHQDLLSKGISYLTTDYVLTEVANRLVRPPYRKSVIRFLITIFSSRGVTILTVTYSHFLRAWQLYKRLLDKQWGLTDCTSFIVMEEQRLREALTADHHFQQAGYTCLLR